MPPSLLSTDMMDLMAEASLTDHDVKEAELVKEETKPELTGREILDPLQSDLKEV